MPTATATKGHVIQVMGPVVDCRFPQDNLPEIYNAVEIKDEKRGVEIVCEVAQHLGDAGIEMAEIGAVDGVSGLQFGTAAVGLHEGSVSHVSGTRIRVASRPASTMQLASSRMPVS